MHPRQRVWILLAVSVFAIGCVQIYGTAPAQQIQKPPAVTPKPKKGPFQPWQKVLKDTRPVEGFFRFHVKQDRTLYLELRPDQLERAFGMVLHFGRGIGDLGLIDGLPLSDTRLMVWRRVGNTIYLVHKNPRFTARPGSAMAVSLADNVGHSIVAAFPIQSIHEKTRHILINVTPFFVSDYAGISSGLRFLYRQKPVQLDRKRSYLDRILGFPKNVEIDVLLTFQTNATPVIFPDTLSDFRSIPIGIHYSLFALPDPPMRPRIADDRVGHFLVAIKDFSRDQEETPFIRYVTRWRLEKKDPGQPLSEPVRPIVFYIDRTVPKRYRKYVREGILAWNRAFEAAGFKNAIVVQEAPDDPNWHAEDIRYSTVRWSAAHRMGFAIGPSQVDPRTGEILNADILISSEFVRAWMFDYQEMAGPDELIRKYEQAIALYRRLQPHLAQRMCWYEFGMAQQLAMQYLALMARGVIRGGQPMPEEFLGDALRDLVMHEVGHTLGLRHNFKGSAGIPYERLHDPAYTSRHGVALSVMDYNPVNIAVDPNHQGHYWNKSVGPYDIWAIRYAYTPVDDTSDSGRATLEAIARENTDPLHLYGTDEDNWLGPYAVDPLTNAWDLGNDPVRYARDRHRLVDRILPHLEQRVIAEGESYVRLRGAFNRLFFERYIATLPLVKFIGGLYFSRAHKGDPHAPLPFTPVPAEKQREALDIIVRYVFAPDAFQFDPEMLNKLAPNRWAHWGVGWFTVPVEVEIHRAVLTVQSNILEQLLHPVRLTRMIDNELRVTDPADILTVAELFATLTRAIWQELWESPVHIRSIRRNVQRAYTGQLIRLLLEWFPQPSGAGMRMPSMAQPAVRVPEDARSLARLELTRIVDRIDRVLQNPDLDTLTRAHLLETRARIRRALQASVQMTIPAGTP